MGWGRKKEAKGGKGKKGGRRGENQKKNMRGGMEMEPVIE